MNGTICLCWRYQELNPTHIFTCMSKHIVLDPTGKYYKDNLLMEFLDGVKTETNSE